MVNQLATLGTHNHAVKASRPAAYVDVDISIHHIDSKRAINQVKIFVVNQHLPGFHDFRFHSLSPQMKKARRLAGPSLRFLWAQWPGPRVANFQPERKVKLQDSVHPPGWQHYG